LVEVEKETLMTRRRALILGAGIAGLSAAALAAAPNILSVQVREGQARAAPSFLSAVVATLAYGDRVEAREEKQSWTRVALPKGGEGWMHASALTPKRIVLQSGSADVNQAASGNEIALAGKGFNAQVEAEYRARHHEVDFAWIDRMEKYEIPPQRLASFVREGELHPQGGE
jgi:SH3-like domain-containing protein